MNITTPPIPDNAAVTPDCSAEPHVVSAEPTGDCAETQDTAPESTASETSAPEDSTPVLSDELQQRLEQVEREAYARGRAEAVDEYLNPTPFFRGLHGAESAVAADPDLEQILSTRRHVW